MALRPILSVSTPNVVAPTKMPISVADEIRPAQVEVTWRSSLNVCSAIVTPMTAKM